MIRVLNLHRDEILWAKIGERWEDPSSPQAEDGNVAVSGIGYLARRGPLAVSEIQTNKQTNLFRDEAISNKAMYSNGIKRKIPTASRVYYEGFV